MKTLQNQVRLCFSGVLVLYATAFSEGNMGTLALFAMGFIVLAGVEFIMSRDWEMEVEWKSYLLDIFNILGIIYVSYEMGFDFGAWKGIPYALLYAIISCVSQKVNTHAVLPAVFCVIVCAFLIGGERQVNISKYRFYCVLLDQEDKIWEFPYQLELKFWENAKKNHPELQNPYQIVKIQDNIPRIIDVTGEDFEPHWWTYPFIIGPLVKARIAMIEHERGNH